LRERLNKLLLWAVKVELMEDEMFGKKTEEKNTNEAVFSKTKGFGSMQGGKK
jgi:hypothetical protein